MTSRHKPPKKGPSPSLLKLEAMAQEELIAMADAVDMAHADDLLTMLGWDLGLTGDELNKAANISAKISKHQTSCS